MRKGGGCVWFGHMAAIVAEGVIMGRDLNKLEIRSISSADEPVLRRLVEISMKGNEYSLDDKERYKEAWDHFSKEFGKFDGDNEVFLTAELDGQLVGFARICCKSEEPEHWWIMGLEVCQEFRRRGIGAELLTKALDDVSDRRGKSVLSWSHKDNRGSLLAHQRAGFAVVADRFEKFDGTMTQDESHWLFRVNLDARSPT